MTLEESKIEIQDIIDIYEKEDMYPLLNDRQISALKVAISALQAQDSPKPTAESVQNVKNEDLILRKAAIEAVDTSSLNLYDPEENWMMQDRIRELPSAQPTLCGYNIEHLILIANVLQKENLPPERVAEALNDISRIVEIVRAEFEETLRKAVEQCKI